MTEDFFKANYPAVWSRWWDFKQGGCDIFELLAFAFTEGGHRGQFWERRRLAVECKNLLADLQREMKGIPSAAFSPDNEENVGSFLPFLSRMANVLPAVIDDLDAEICGKAGIH